MANEYDKDNVGVKIKEYVCPLTNDKSNRNHEKGEPITYAFTIDLHCSNTFRQNKKALTPLNQY